MGQFCTAISLLNGSILDCHNQLKLVVKTESRMNYHDALISLVMRRRRIRKLATFDRDFGYVEQIPISGSMPLYA